MKFKISHETQYVFSDKVFLEPHYLRFRPKQSAFIKVINFSIDLTSRPEGHRIIEDEELNVVDFYWFEDLTDRLSISVESVVHTKEYNPFNFLIHPSSFNTIPFSYSAEQQSLLYSALQHAPLSPHLASYANDVLVHSRHDTITFISKLTKQIHTDFLVEYREEGAPLEPDETFSIKKGSCRDLSWMQINMLRSFGIAARFVSGYFYFEAEEENYELHAWVEVFIPGTGWLGFDPSHGILTGNTHFALACSAFPPNTMPVSGGIRGSATSTLTTNLIIERL